MRMIRVSNSGTNYFLSAQVSQNKMARFSVPVLFLLFFLMHVNVALTVNGQFLAANFPAFILCIVVLATNWKAIKPKSSLALLQAALYVLIVTASLSYFYGHSLERLLSVAMLAYSLLMGYAVLILLRKSGKNNVLSALRYFLIFLFVGSLLESYTSFVYVSDAFREFLHSWNGIYSADLRDQIYYGGVRPKLFSSEPSYLGTTFSLSIVLYTGLGERRAVNAIFTSLFLSGAALYICKSPTVIYGFALCVLVTFAKLLAGKNINNRKIVILSFLVIGVFLAFPVILNEVFQLWSLTDSLLGSASWQVRQILPFYFSVDFLKSYPFFGAGFGGDDFLTIKITDYFFQNGVFSRYPWMEGSQAMHLITNGFYYWLSQMGLIGTIVFLIPLRKFCENEGLAFFALSVTSTVIYWHTFGSISSPHSWVPFFMFSWMYNECISRRKNIGTY